MARFLPGNRDALLTEWQRFTAHVVIFFLRHMGGVRFGELPDIPATAGVLVLMNHQSLLDIPLVVASMHGVYPHRDAPPIRAWRPPNIPHDKAVPIPLGRCESNPARRVEAAPQGSGHLHAPPHHLPGGNPQQTGRIGPFKTLGLATILAARRWSVYVVVADGLWKWTRLGDFFGNLPLMRTRVECRGPFESPAPDEDPDGFIRRCGAS